MQKMWSKRYSDIFRAICSTFYGVHQSVLTHTNHCEREKEKERVRGKEREKERKKSQGTLEYLVEILCKVSWRSYDLVYLHDLQHQLVISVQDTA